MRETADMRLSRISRRRIVKGKIQGNRSENDGSSIWEKVSRHYSLCNLDGSVTVLKLLYGVWKEVILRKQKIVQSTSSLSLLFFLGDRWRCYLWRMQEFTEVYVLFQKLFFLTWITTGGAYYQNKEGQGRVTKSKTALVLEIRSLHQRRACY